MEEFLHNLSAYIAEHPQDIHLEDADTILDALFWSYSETARADSRAVQQYNENLNRLLQGLPAERVNTIIDTVNDLCWEHERQGFINGFKLGMRLEQEISQCPHSHILARTILTMSRFHRKYDPALYWNERHELYTSCFSMNSGRRIR